MDQETIHQCMSGFSGIFGGVALLLTIYSFVKDLGDWGIKAGLWAAACSLVSAALMFPLYEAHDRAMPFKIWIIAAVILALFDIIKFTMTRKQLQPKAATR